MPQNYLAAVQVTKMLVLSALGTAITAVGTAAKAPDIVVQLNERHSFLYLEVPFWWFLAASVILAVVGAIWSLTTDTLKGRGNLVVKMLTAITVGLVMSFIVLPAVMPEPDVSFLMIAALSGSYAGTILLYLSARLLNDQDMHDAVIAVSKKALIDGWSKATSIIAILLGGRK